MAEPAQFSGRAAPGGGPQSALVVGALVVAFVVLAVAKPWDQPKATPSPQPAVSSSPTPVARSAPPVESPATPSAPPFFVPAPFTLDPPPPGGATWTALRWQAFDVGDPIAHLGPTVRWSGGFASLGDDGAGAPLLWTSPDAIDWSPVASGTATTFWPGMRVEGVAPLGHQLLAVTSMPAQTTAGELSTPAPRVLSTWLSADGAAWQMRGGPILPEPITLDGTVLTAGSGGRAVVAWNEAPDPGGQGTGHLAVTTDGANWRQVPAGALPSGFTAMDLAAAPGGGFLVAGKTLVDGLAGAAIMRSDPTAQVWTPVALPQSPELAIGERASVVWRLAVGAKGVLATGDSPSREVWWWSADGGRWTVLAGFDPVGSSGCPGSTVGCGLYPDGEIVGDGERLVALRSAPSAVAWSSADGRTWRPVATTPFEVPQPATRIALLPGGVIVTTSSGAWYGYAASRP